MSPKLLKRSKVVLSQVLMNPMSNSFSKWVFLHSVKQSNDKNKILTFESVSVVNIFCKIDESQRRVEGTHKFLWFNFFVNIVNG